jgi:hypothetical protein
LRQKQVDGSWKKLVGPGGPAGDDNNGTCVPSTT